MTAGGSSPLETPSRKQATVIDRRYRFFSPNETSPPKFLPAMPTADLFPDLFTAFSITAHFSEATLRAVEQTLTEKGGKPYLKCLVRKKEVLTPF